MPEEQFQLRIWSVQIHTYLATVVSKQLLPRMTIIIISQLSALYIKIIPLGNICIKLTLQLLILHHQLPQFCLYIPPGLYSPTNTVLLEKPTHPQSGIKFTTLHGISLVCSQELHTSPYPEPDISCPCPPIPYFVSPCPSHPVLLLTQNLSQIHALL